MADLDEQKRDEEMRRGDEARRLLDHPLLKSALEEGERQIIEALVQTHNKDSIEKLHALLVATRQVRDRISSHIETGKLAAIQLEEKRRLKLWRFN